MGLPLAIFGAAALTAAGSLGTAAMNRNKGNGSRDGGFETAPEYPESEAARKEWWQKLQNWEKEPGYGAISPEWDDIWDLAVGKVNAYYQGSPLAKGAYDRLNASIARKNITGPAGDILKSRMAVEQGGQIADLSKQEAINKANFSEQGRQNWLSSMQGLSSLRPAVQYVPGQVDNSGSNLASAVGSLGSGLSNYFLQQQQQDWLTNLLKPQSPSTAQVYGMGTVPVAPPNYYLGN